MNQLIQPEGRDNTHAAPKIGRDRSPRKDTPYNIPRNIKSEFKPDSKVSTIQNNSAGVYIGPTAKLEEENTKINSANPTTATENSKENPCKKTELGNVQVANENIKENPEKKTRSGSIKGKKEKVKESPDKKGAAEATQGTNDTTKKTTGKDNSTNDTTKETTGKDNSTVKVKGTSENKPKSDADKKESGVNKTADKDNIKKSPVKKVSGIKMSAAGGDKAKVVKKTSAEEEDEFRIAADLTLYANPLRCLNFKKSPTGDIKKTPVPATKNKDDHKDGGGEMIAADLNKYGSPLDK